MSQNISDFYRVAQERDFARKFQFRLYQLGPVTMNEDDFVYVTTAALPGREITNVPTPFMGLDFNVPGTAKYPGSAGYKVQFRCDAAYNIRNVLEQAQINTFDDATSTGDYNIGTADSIISLMLMDKTNTPIKNYQLIGAYVQAIGESTYEIGDSGQIQTIDVTLAYHYWRAINITA